MPKLSWWKPALMTLFAGLSLVAALTAGARPGRTAMQVPAPQGKQEFFYRGSASCAGSGCHSYPEGSKEPYPNPFAEGFIKRNENITWRNEDKHSLAYSNLQSPRGQAMAKLLGVDVTQSAGGCLGCHSSGDDMVKKRAGDLFDTADGVSCENCHGPSSRWRGDHDQTDFRKKTAEERKAIGMIDVRSPEIQAAQCLSCHIGDADQKKLVTHEMYAAGHPPLPSIEVATFGDIMHRHWILVSEKKNDELKKIPGYMYKPGQKDRTKLAILGAAVALETSMKLLADEARGKGDSTVPGRDWPDYARFDCWSCHHDLKRDSWRQARGFKGEPGRPPISEWPLALVELGIDRLEMIGKADKLRDGLAGHQKAVLGEANSRPYGRKVPLAEAADEFAKWAHQLVGKLSDAPYDEAAARDLLRALVKKSTTKAFDYDEARHVGWTIRILVKDSGPKLENRSEIEAIVAKIGEGLKLDLPAGRERQIMDELGKALEKINSYEPSMFQAHLKELARLLGLD